jgi:DNA replication protein DnaC
MTTLAPAVDLDALLRRLHLPTVRRLYPELVQRADPDGLSYRDFLAVLMAEEVAHRAQTRIQRCVRRAHFPFLKTIEEFDFTFQSSVRLALLGSVLGPELVTQGHCLIASGPSGTGKTHLAVAIAYRAIQNGFDARFTTATALIDDLSVATRKGKLRAALSAYTHPHVLVIDEVGYLSYGPDAANVLFHVVNDRYLHHRPMIFTTNKPLTAWGRVLHDPDLAQAILDRVLERGRHLELRGPSYRTRHLPLDLNQPPEPSSQEPARISGNHRPQFPEPTCDKHAIAPDQLTIHADRGSSMTSKPVAWLLADLGVTRTHSRPHVSNDNPFSEAQFKTLKYRPDFPDRFATYETARAFCHPFFTWYNTEHRHGGIGLLTPAMVHYGQAEVVRARRAAILAAAYAAHPERFVRRPPRVPLLPSAVWINPPKADGGATPPSAAPTSLAEPLGASTIDPDEGGRYLDTLPQPGFAAPALPSQPSAAAVQ